ncbi:MAG: cytochrome [Tardiphaga sp.]|jgi:cytochrome b561|nr:cytochrome [Tardiphaga sp.]
MILHWLVAALIVVNVGLIWSVDWLPDDSVRLVIDAHKSTGITVLGLVLLRLLWRAAHPPPPLPEAYPRWERAAAHAGHIALYLLILALPLSGWMHDSAWKAAGEVPMYWYGLFQWPRIGWIMHIEPALKERLHDLFGGLHAWLSYVLYALFVLHVGAALKHQWWDKHAELQRMLPDRTG